MLPVDVLEARLALLAQSAHLSAQPFAEVCYGDTCFPLWAFFWGDEALPSVDLFAGIHGNEPGGIEAALRLLESLAAGASPLARHRLRVFPCLNPSGLADGIRVNRAGQDVNRQFHADQTQESAALRRFLDLRHTHLLVDLHTDADAQGYYLFELKQDRVKSLARPLLESLLAAGYPVEEQPFYAGYVGHHGLFAPTRAGLEEFHQRALGLSLAEWGWSKGVPRTYSFEAPFAPEEERPAVMHGTALLALFRALEA